ncbi:Bug family tripartite tricarboxylate transporter substrate binding protein [Halomonas sp. H2]|uniref:Bug family tripartite tricarboxylate transporter substrate binding protein n=1 Tax=Halomonas sp. H2 TaxID=261936 RepID=UPI003CF26993
MRPSNTKGRNAVLTVLGIALTASLTVPAYAADYPNKPIQMIVSYGAGGSTDTMARIFAKHAEEALGERIVVVNRPGAGGELGWVHLANSDPDGYTIGLINSPVIEVYPITRADTVGYSLDDIQPLANIVTDPGVLAVADDSPYKNLDDLVSASQTEPGTVTVSHEGAGGDDHLAALDFATAADIDLNFVSFSGNAEATAALLGGHIDAFEGNMSEAAAQINEGKLRGLAVWSDKRMDAIPNVPTGQEQGYDVITAASRGLAVPAGVPDEIYEKLIEVSQKVMESPEFKAELAKLNMPLNPLYGQEYADFIDANYERLKGMWEQDPWIEQ